MELGQPADPAGVPFSATLISPLLGLVALPYFLAMASDLRYCGYKRLDVCRIYGFNLVLLPVNLAGTLSSVVQGITASKAPFARTPKVRNRTVVPPFFVIAPYLMIGLAGFTCYTAYWHHNVENMAYAALNVILACYAAKAFTGCAPRWWTRASTPPRCSTSPSAAGGEVVRQTWFAPYVDVTLTRPTSSRAPRPTRPGRACSAS